MEATRDTTVYNSSAWQRTRSVEEGEGKNGKKESPEDQGETKKRSKRRRRWKKKSGRKKERRSSEVMEILYAGLVS